VNAGHGLDYENVEPIAALPWVEELNIGFAIVARSVFSGVDESVRTMARLIQSANVRAAQAKSSQTGFSRSKEPRAIARRAALAEKKPRARRSSP
jgi:hypothetical protein